MGRSGKIKARHHGRGQVKSKSGKYSRTALGKAQEPRALFFFFFFFFLFPNQYLTRSILISPPVAPKAARFSLQQEARNTGSHIRDWNTPQRLRLRHRSIKFISESNGHQRDDDEDTVEWPNDGPKEQISHASHREHQHHLDDSPSFATPRDENTLRPTSRPSSPASEGSSDDEKIVFRGRRRQENGNNSSHEKPQPAVNSFATIYSEEEHFPDPKTKIEPPVYPRDASYVTETAEANSHHVAPQLSHPKQNGKAAEVEHVDTSPMRTSERRPSVCSARSLTSEVDTIADYIANIDKDYFDSDIPSEAPPEYSKSTRASSTEPRSPILSSNASTDTLNEQADDLDEPSNWSKARLHNEFDILYEAEVDLEVPGEDIDREVEEVNTSDDSSQIYYKSSRRKRPYMPASSFADALESDPYYGLDIMDFNRPSLRSKGKGKKAPPVFGVSDSELESELLSAWEKDRQQKGSKKKRREELRSQGLLGRKAGTGPDLKAKYSDGMDFDDLKQELGLFLLSSQNR